MGTVVNCMGEKKKAIREVIEIEEQRALTDYYKTLEIPVEFSQVQFFEKCVAYGRFVALRDLQIALKDYL